MVQIYCQILILDFILEQLGLCPEASNHLKTMKDTLIEISNDLIDNADEMTSQKIEALRQERFASLLFAVATLLRFNCFWEQFLDSEYSINTYERQLIQIYHFWNFVDLWIS